MTTRKRDQQTAADKEPFTGPRRKRRSDDTCPECCGSGGDCDAGDDGRTISWECQACGGTGRKPPSDDGAPEGPVFL
jgi:hypothetical protein